MTPSGWQGGGGSPLGVGTHLVCVVEVAEPPTHPDHRLVDILLQANAQPESIVRPPGKQLGHLLPNLELPRIHPMYVSYSRARAALPPEVSSAGRHSLANVRRPIGGAAVPNSVYFACPTLQMPSWLSISRCRHFSNICRAVRRSSAPHFHVPCQRQKGNSTLGPTRMIVGLGNAGDKHKGERHNIGNEVLCAFATDQLPRMAAPPLQWETKVLSGGAKVLECNTEPSDLGTKRKENLQEAFPHVRTVLLQPQTAINRAGSAVRCQPIAQRHCTCNAAQHITIAVRTTTAQPYANASMHPQIAKSRKGSLFTTTLKARRML